MPEYKKTTNHEIFGEYLLSVSSEPTEQVRCEVYLMDKTINIYYKIKPGISWSEITESFLILVFDYINQLHTSWDFVHLYNDRLE